MNRKIIGICILVLVSVTGLFAQDGDVINVDTKLINISVAARDKDKKLVEGLAKENFSMSVNGKRRSIDFLSSADDSTSFGVIYDLHPKSTENTRSVLAALEDFEKSLPEGNEFFLTLFNEYGSLDLTFVPTEEQIRRHLSFADRTGPNSLYDVIHHVGQKLLTRPNRKRSLIIISDGKDDRSHHSFSEISRHLKTFNIQVFAVVPSDADSWEAGDFSIGDSPSKLEIDRGRLDSAALESLAKVTGGSASDDPALSNAALLASALRGFETEMRSRYVIGFYPPKGKKFKVELEARDSAGNKLELSYRGEVRIER